VIEKKNGSCQVLTTPDGKTPRSEGAICMSEIALASINNFGTIVPNVSTEEQIFVLNGPQLQAIISQAIQAAIQPLVARIESLESLVAQKSPCSAQEGQENLLEVGEHQAQIIQALNAKLEVISETLEDVETRIDSVDESTQLERAYDRQRIAKLEGVVTTPTPLTTARGCKTEARIAKLKEVLKGRGGSSTFAQIQRDLGISPSQLSKLVSRLDKRIFEVWRRAGGKHGEKVLGLRARLFD
jgi:DNA-binding Lrp family transcriptional regulator